MACDPSNPIKGGMCSLKNTGPPDVILPLRGAISTPEQLGSSKDGNYTAIGKNLGALDYYATSLGEGSQFKGYGIRKAYSTGIECKNIKGQDAYRLADGTAVGIPGEYGVVPRLIGSLAGLVPGDLVSSAKTGTTCKMMWVHENTDAEANNIRHKGMGGVPSGNKVMVSDSNGVDYIGMNQKCEAGEFGPNACKQYPVQVSDIEPGEEGFRGRRGGSRRGGGRRSGSRRRGRRHGSSWRMGHSGYGPTWIPHWNQRWYNRYPVYYSPPVVIDSPVYERTSPEVVIVRDEPPANPAPSNDTAHLLPMLLLAGVVLAGSVIALRK